MTIPIASKKRVLKSRLIIYSYLCVESWFGAVVMSVRL
jgi:hypothetical protein